MISSKDLQMFESVARGNPRLREWLLSELADTHGVLVKMNDEAQLRRAQGRAQCLQSLIDNLDAATAPPRQRAGSST